MKKIILLIFLVFFTAAGFANEISQSDFSGLVKEVSEIYQRGETADYALTPRAEEIFSALAKITIIKSKSSEYYVDLWWINNLVQELQLEAVPRKRRLMFSNFVDTMNGLLGDLSSENTMNGATRKEMQDALDRAMGITRVVRVANGYTPGKALEWAGGGSFVVEGSGDGEGISIVSGAVSSGGSAFSGGRFSGAGASVRYGGSGSSGSTGSTSGSGSYSGATVSGRAASSINNKTPTRVSSAVGTSSPSQSGAQPSQSNTGKTYKVNNPSSPVSRPGRVRNHPAPPRPQPPKPQPPRPPKPPKPEPKPTNIANSIFYLILAVCVIAMLAMIYFMVRKTRKKIAEEKEEVATLEAGLPPERMKIETVYDKALRAAANGDYAEGIRLLTIGALLLLEQQRVVNFQDTMTNGEYLAKLMQERQLYSLFREPMTLFDMLIYGFRKPGEKEFERFRKFYLELEKVQS